MIFNPNKAGIYEGSFSLGGRGGGSSICYMSVLDNIKSHKKPRFLPVFRRYAFRKTTEGSVKLTTLFPQGRFRVKTLKEKLETTLNADCSKRSFFCNVFYL